MPGPHPSVTDAKIGSPSITRPSKTDPSARSSSLGPSARWYRVRLLQLAQRSRLPDGWAETPPEKSEDFEGIAKDFDRVILPGCAPDISCLWSNLTLAFQHNPLAGLHCNSTVLAIY